jgi:replicative DNA helicase
MSDPLVHMQAERAVIGCVLQGATVEETGPLPATCFGHTPNRLVWEAVLSLPPGHLVDHLTLAERLKALGVLAEVGGPEYLMALDQSVPLVGNLRAYCEQLRDYAQRRALDAHGAAVQVAARDFSRAPVSTAVEAAARFASLDAEAVDESAEGDLMDILTDWDAVRKGEIGEPYLPLPWQWMTEAGVKGFPQSLSVWSGRSGIGKTAGLSTCMAHWLWTRPEVGGVFGLEDGTRWLPERWLAYKLGMDYADVGASSARLTIAQEQAMEDFAPRLHDILRGKLKRYKRPGIKASELVARCRRWVSEGVKWIVIDHGLRVDYEAGKGREDIAIGRTVDALANLAFDRKVHIIAAWHLNRANDDNSMPQRKDLKESGYLDAAARLILGAWRQPTGPDGQPRTLLTVVKANKVAPEGLTGCLQWAGRSGMFEPRGGYVVDFAAERQKTKDTEHAARASRKLFGGGQAA